MGFLEALDALARPLITSDPLLLTLDGILRSDSVRTIHLGLTALPA